MTETDAADRVAGALGRPRAFDTIVYGGLVIGVLDFVDASTFFPLVMGVPWQRVWQFVASAVLGRASFDGGGATVALGILLHFCVAASIAAVFYLGTRLLPMLYGRPLVWGPVYGVVAHFVMQYVVVPLTAAPPGSGKFSLPSFLNSVIGHALLVGLPAALIARRSAASRSRV